MEQSEALISNAESTRSAESKMSVNRPMTPLWVISLFISLTELALTVALVQTKGGIQVTITAFVVAFPAFIAAAFFIILWRKPHHFYAPTEYGQQTTAREYIDAITQKRSLDESQIYSIIQNAVRSSVASDETVSKLTEVASRQTDKQVEKEVTMILDSAVERAVENIHNEVFLTIDPRPLLGYNAQIWQIPYDRYDNISGLLDEIWISITEISNDKIPAYTYSEKWVLRDIKSGKLFMDMGRQWARRHNQSVDTRSLKDVSIFPGMRLESVAL